MSRLQMLTPFLAFVLFVGMAGTALAWQATKRMSAHTDPFGGQINSGYLSGDVRYESGKRRVYSHSWFNWNTEVGWLQDNHGGWDNKRVASVFHVFDKNTSSYNAIRYDNWWASSLPDAWGQSKHSGGEFRCGVGRNGYENLVAFAYYTCDARFKDGGYPSTKTNGELDHDTYWIGLTPIYRDWNVKLCIDNDSMGTPDSSGICP
jgi:hypothetical protein